MNEHSPQKHESIMLPESIPVKMYSVPGFDAPNIEKYLKDREQQNNEIEAVVMNDVSYLARKIRANPNK
jgi:hypothetical protein